MTSHGTPICPYHLGFFEKPGKPGKKKSIDIVATKWISSHPRNKQAVLVKYPPPPYTTTFQADYNNFLKDLRDAPTTWKNYTFKIRGRAGKL